MNKLKNKIFIVISSILSIFLISILFIFNYQNYQAEEKHIIENLKRAGNIKERLAEPKVKDDLPEIKGFDNRKFIDLEAYTIEIENNKIKNITSHSFEDKDEEQVEIYVNKILNKNKESSYNFLSIYFNKYSYEYKDSKTLILVNNSFSTYKLINLLKSSLIIFIILEIVIIFVSFRLTKWIIKPVISSFNRQKEFICDASHELKTPVSVILANAEMATIEKDNPKWLNNIKSESLRMSNLISNLLDLSRLENENSKENVEEINLSKVTELAILPFESLIYEHKLKLKYDISENINFKCNQEQIKQLIAILIDNAIKHSLKNSSIEINLKEKKNDIIFSISNKGENISQEDLKRIFERFYRTEKSRNRNENNYGLGLAIAKQIASLHNGKIEATSLKGKTTFTITFKQVT